MEPVPFEPGEPGYNEDDEECEHRILVEVKSGKVSKEKDAGSRSVTYSLRLQHVHPERFHMLMAVVWGYGGTLSIFTGHPGEIRVGASCQMQLTTGEDYKGRGWAARKQFEAWLTQAPRKLPSGKTRATDDRYKGHGMVKLGDIKLERKPTKK